MKSALNKPEEFEQYYQALVRDYKLFETHRDVYIIAILLGFMSGQKKKLGKTGGEAIKEHLFVNDKDLLDIVAVLDNNDIKILLKENKDEKMAIFEEYAYKGIEILVNNVFVGMHTDIDKLVEYVLSYAPDNKGDKVDLSDMFEQLAQSLQED